MKTKLSVIILFFFLLTISAQKTTVAPKSKIISASQLLKDIETLSADAMEGRGVGTKGGELARNYVEKRFRESGIKQFGDSYLQPFDFSSRTGKKFSGANVVGFIEGKKFKDKFIVVTAHYDHVGINEKQIYNGADDNASGTAALFSIAQYFSKKKPSHTLIFVAFDAEESGLRGARAFLEKPPVAKEKIALNINMDMLANNDKNELYAAGTYHYPQLKPLLEAVARKAKVKLLFGHDRPELKDDDWTFQSDHGVFHREKIPFVYFGVENHKDYHQPTDDFENINQEFYVRAVETVIAVVKVFDKDLM
jgi:Zn-dependent M28 family amino/carboxypeptidase